MFLPTMSYTCLASGVFMVSSSAFVIYQVHRGSKSQFAYVLMAFTFLDGAQNFAQFFVYVYLHPINVGEKTYYSENIYASQTTFYCYYLVSLQSWIFGMKYLESAMLCSLTAPCIPYFKVRYINWAGILIYTLAMLAMFIWSLVTYPGYVNDDSFD